MIKRFIISFCIGLLLIENAVAQDDSTLKDKPFSFNASYVGDYVANFNGGLKKGSIFLGMANINMLFDTKKAGLWNGGEFFIRGTNTHGAEPSANYLGDFQVVSNIEAGNLTFLQEFWYKQTIGNATFIVGLQDLAIEFLSSENASIYLNSSFGVHSTISNNLSVPIFPLTSFGAQIHYNFNKKITAKIAIFDGLVDDFSINPYNISWKLKKKDGYFSFYEISYRNDAEKFPGIYKIGSSYHNTHSVKEIYEDETIINNHPKKWGFYATIDQTIYKNNNENELTMFSQASFSPNSTSENYYYLGTGFNYSGLIKNRIDDVVGLGVAHAGMKNNNGSETTIELTYKAQINKNIFIQPDLQYIINPTSTGEKLKNVFVGIIRFGINF